MSGIPIYMESPISPAKAQGATPQTALPQTQQKNPPTPASNTATTTASATSLHGYTPAQPGASVGPAPTASAQQSQYAPPQPTPTKTQTAQNTAPPPPQPGAFPTPSNIVFEAEKRPSLPPPPKAGETAKAFPQASAPAAATERTSSSSPTRQRPQPYPPQMSITAPTFANAAQPIPSSTMNTFPTRASNPVELPTPFSETPPQLHQQQQQQQPPPPSSTSATTPTTTNPPSTDSSAPSLTHPPNYRQNPYAPDMPPSALLAQQQNASTSFSTNDTSSLGYNQNNSRRGSVFTTDEEGDGGIWDTAKKWATAAGNKASEVEGEVWRRIGKE